MTGVRQLITRIDDDLHARLKAIATQEQRSVNAVVTEAIEAVVARGTDPRRALRHRAGALGVAAARTGSQPPDDDARAALIADLSGVTVADLLEADRRSR